MGVQKMTKILICDDEPGLRLVLKKYATFEQYDVSEASNGQEAIALCQKETFDIIIMDVMMPELDGFSTVKEIRKTSDTPVIMLSARGEEYDKILGFEVGVDDYVVKPFSSKEIMMRIQAILRRGKTIQDNQDEQAVYKFEGLDVDMTAYSVKVDGEEVRLTPKVYDLLFYLIRNKGIVIPREKIVTEIWGMDYYGDDRTLDTHMKMLRKSLGRYSKKIQTLRGIGYRFEG